MANNHQLLDLDVAALGELYRRREVSPVEVTAAYLDRIEQTEPKINAYITVTADLARAAAQAAEREMAADAYRGPFHGVPTALKDLCYTRDIRTTGGSKILADFIPGHDATVWTRLREAGAILLGKLNLHEFAAGGSSNNPHWGPVHNPYDLDRIPGGSSGGSAAALMARSALAAIGTDTGGSIRIPAAVTGCVGLKPTYSRVSRYGVIPLSYSVDHVGPMTRTVRDAALMLNVIAGPDPHDTTSSSIPVPDYTRELEAGIKGMRVAVVRELATQLATEVEKSFKSALKTLEGLGATVEEVSIPFLATSAASTARTMIVRAEALEYHERWLRERASEYGPDVRALLEQGMMVSASNYVRAHRVRALMLAETERTLEKYSVLISPACKITAPKIGEDRVRMPSGETLPVLAALVALVAPFNATGQPAIAVPSGLSTDGLPISIQFVGRSFDEATVLRVAYAYEQARGSFPFPKI
ncbi:MAG: Asp-tRNA(Asn)/Glu-tRNA(Gln) amidotransferase subunit GatA [Candidatus Binataceae bacterium]|nr:Asp-tRNA(Asn)/Glu-tRNA(Gln) amidotransferase subunit GatA [Candidatus Binataceae bacterium]